MRPKAQHGISARIFNVALVLLLWELFRLFRTVYLVTRASTFQDAISSAIGPDRLGETFTVEIFTAPKPFVGPNKDVSLRAIRSWQRLKPTPKITLLGNEVGYESVATEYGLNLHSDIDKTFMGVPLFNSMFHVANQSTATISVIINGDIILLDSFMHTLKKAWTRFDHFLIVSARFDLEKVPDHFDEDSENYYERLKEFATTNASLHTYGGMDLWAWNTNGPRLFDAEMPHFIFGRGKYDNWLTHETIAAGNREVIDASEAVLSIHIRHDYNLVSQGADHPQVDGSVRGRRLLEQGMFWSEQKKSKFELFINIYLSMNTGSYKNQYGSVLFAPWRIARSMEEDGMSIVRRERPGACNCEYSSTNVATQTDPIVKEGSRVIRCGAVSHEHSQDFTLPVTLAETQKEASSFGKPLILQSVIERVAEDQTIIVTALNYGYREMMMNWVCNMRKIGVSNFIVAAFDEDLYKFALTRGLPVYYENSLPVRLHSSLAEAQYGSSAFKELTKMKSRVVLRFLKLGYDTVWTDTDIVWFKNPLESMKRMEVDLAIQTNAPDEEEANGRRRINSGFYLARSNERMIHVFEEIIKFAAASRMSEQPCFYDVICGKNGERRVGNDMCVYKRTKTKLLDRSLYPNGMTKNIWDVECGTMKKRLPEMLIVHNNWVKGEQAKWARIKKHGLVFHNPRTGLCNFKQIS